MAKYKNLDPILHSQLRLAVVSILMNVDAADFTYIKEQTEATAGNLSVQISKLKDAGYIEVEKKFKGNYPQTRCLITPLGRERFEAYVNDLKGYISGS